ncbi:M3 family metallopeptidase [Sphingomonas sp. ASV193]|uniref:M3 family metallopeptidase n=1 Tax=Sphingomonas sp. ASV193 TaxID=3144405 RepID=UPI0032E90F82
MRHLVIGLLAASVLATPVFAAAPKRQQSAEAFIGPVDGRPQTAAQIMARCDRVIAEADRRRIALEQDKRPVSLDTYSRYNDLWILLNGTDAGLYQEVSLTDAARKAAGACNDKVTAAQAKITLSRPLYDKLKALSATSVDPVTAFGLKRDLLAFEMSGVQLDAAGRAKAQALTEAIGKAGTRFDAAIADDKTTIAVTPAELEGLPADFIAGHKVGADGKIVLTMAYPDAIPVLTYARREDTRKAMFTAFFRRAYPANEQNLRDLINLRDQLAKLIGKPSYAALSLQDRMLDTPEKVHAFLDEVTTIALPAAQRDLAKKQAVVGGSGPFAMWNNSYASDQVKKSQYGYDTQEARKYFAFEKVQAGILKLSEDLFGVKIRKWNTPVWTKGVDAFEMVENGKVIGRFYFDLHPRPGKYSHANAMGLRSGLAGRSIPVGALVTNFPGGDGSEGLMTHNDVVTFLHEYGHLLHGIFGGQEQRWASRSGISTEWDFVEAPSQMLENWVFDYDTLARFATDSKGRTIPRELVAAMNRSRYFNMGGFDRTQSGYANMSLGFYEGPAPANLGAFQRAAWGKYDLVPVPDFVESQDSFGHLNGYGAAYYTYVWSKVIADDLFSRFEKEGLRNRKTAADYRRFVIGPGGDKPAAELIADFLGRPLSLDAHKAELDKDR